MWNILKRPIEKESFDAWAKISDDVTKVAILTMPVVLFGSDNFMNKLINIALLLFSIYTSLALGRFLRHSKINSGG